MDVMETKTASQSQKLMIFVLTMSLYGLATLFTELIPKFQVGIVEFSVESGSAPACLQSTPCPSPIRDVR